MTDAFHINWPPGAKVRVLANSVTRGEHGDPYSETQTVIGDEASRPIYLFSTAGAGVGRIMDIVGAAERVRAIAAEASRLLDANAAPSSAPVELASPACHAHEMDDRYMGFATRRELLPALNELLEAERAGARATLAIAKDIGDGALKPLIMAIHRDEARRCGVLTRAIHHLQGAPSPKTGAFYGKVMAIPGLVARLAFLNRGQGWVVGKLRALLPTIRDEAIHADLSAMLASHERNIGLVAAELPAPDRSGAPS